MRLVGYADRRGDEADLKRYRAEIKQMDKRDVELADMSEKAADDESELFAITAEASLNYEMRETRLWQIERCKARLAAMDEAQAAPGMRR